MKHIKRVVRTAKKIAIKENAEMNVVVPAAWLHDCVNVPKNSPERSKASALSAERAIEFLQQNSFPEGYLQPIHHAIVAHSFSANIECQTLEAKVVQDADRLDALGAIGLYRCLAVGIQLNAELYCELDPFCESREPDDANFTVDHFFTKLFLLPNSMKTESGRQEARQRVIFMQSFIDQLRTEI